jgi:hypothetical protein
MPGHSDVIHYGQTHWGEISSEDRAAWLDFICGICDVPVHGVVVARSARMRDDVVWLMCPRCGAPHAYAFGFTSPSPKLGPRITGLPELVAKAYDEARAAIGARAPTGCELLCRKILMYAAVDKAGAEAGKPFVTYIDALEAANYITPPMRAWVDQIRTRANDATHGLPDVDRDRAENTLEFTATLLRLVYEMEHQTNRFTGSAPASA